MSAVNVNVFIDEELKKRAEVIFANAKLDMSTAINLFFRQVVYQGRIPFEVATDIPNAETLVTIQEMDDMISGNVSAKKYSSTEELFKDLDDIS